MRSGNGKSKPFCCDRVSEFENRTCNLRQEPTAGNWLACGHVISRRLCGASVPTDHACRCGVHQPPQGNPACNCRRMVKEKFQSLLPHHPAGRFDARLGYSSARLLPSRAGIRFSEHSPVCHTSPPLRKATGQPESVATGQPGNRIGCIRARLRRWGRCCNSSRWTNWGDGFRRTAILANAVILANAGIQCVAGALRGECA